MSHEPEYHERAYTTTDERKQLQAPGERLTVKCGHMRIHLTPEEAAAIRRCLDELLAKREVMTLG